VSTLNLINRNELLLDRGIALHNSELKNVVSSSRFLIIGDAGSKLDLLIKEFPKIVS
jgi:hypothetical protein